MTTLRSRIVMFCAAALVAGVAGARAQETFSFTEGYYQPSATTGPTFPAWSSDGKQLAFAMEGSIWIIDATGGDARQVTTAFSYDSQPQWSPDGRSIVYVGDLAAFVHGWVEKPRLGYAVTNLAAAEPLPMREVLALLFACAGREARFTFEAGGRKPFLISLDRALALGYAPSSVRASMESFVRDCTSYPHRPT